MLGLERDSVLRVTAGATRPLGSLPTQPRCGSMMWFYEGRVAALAAALTANAALLLPEEKVVRPAVSGRWQRLLLAF